MFFSQIFFFATLLLYNDNPRAAGIGPKSSPRTHLNSMTISCATTTGTGTNPNALVEVGIIQWMKPRSQFNPRNLFGIPDNLDHCVYEDSSFHDHRSLAATKHLVLR